MFKPMLAGKCEDAAKLVFPVLASAKLDGIRATVQGGILLSRSLKPIPNVYVQDALRGLPEGLDGELIAGDPTATDAYRRTESITMSEDKPADDVVFHVFDRFSQHARFEDRFRVVATALNYELYGRRVRVVPHKYIHERQQLLEMEEELLELGHEGVMIRSLGGPYKEGRSTAKEGYLLKLKRFLDSEAVIIGYQERMHNANEAKQNALGHTERSSHKANLIGHGDLGALNVRDVKTGVEFDVGTGYDAATRKELWKVRDTLLGKTIVYKYFPTGSKDRPRFPVFKGFRSKLDL